MIAALIIVFREVFEAGLIIGIILAVTRSVPHRNRWVVGGIIAGVLGACVVAAFTGALSSLFEGMGQELFNAGVLIIAVAMLTWHNVWMAKHGREMAQDMRAVGKAVVEGSKSLLALAIVIAVAVLREGSEVALFLYGVIATDGATGLGILAGGLAGVVLGAIVSALTYGGLVVIPVRHLFLVTTVLIALLAAGMATQAVAFLEQASIVNALSGTAWDTEWLLSQKSLVGSALHTLIGYSDQPTQMQVVVYVAVLVVTFLLMRAFSPPPRNKGKLAPAE